MEHVKEAVGRMHTQNKKHVTRNKMYMKHKISRINIAIFQGLGSNSLWCSGKKYVTNPHCIMC